jgi:aminopeptidase N
MTTIVVIALLALPNCHDFTVLAGLAGVHPRRAVAAPGDADALKLITPDLVKPLIIKLSGDEFEGRGAGYPGEKKAAEFIAKEFKRIGLTPAGDNARSTYFQEFKFHPHHPVTPWEVLTSRNVLGFIEGQDPLLKQEVVVIAAHYDGQGRLGQADPFRKPPTDPQSGPIWSSANDNLTGVSAVLAAAWAIKQSQVRPKRSILFAAFGCEEHGMSGSIAYVSHPSFPLDRHVAMINFEKLGRAPDQPLNAGATGTSSGWVSTLRDASTLTGTQVRIPMPFVIPDSDHYPFAASGIPAVILSVNGPDDAHSPADVAEKIDYARVAEYARYGLAVLLELASLPQRISYSDVRGFDPGLIAHLASDAEADRAGLRSPDSGLKVTGVIPGGPADRAGLQPGDLILRGADTAFRRDMTLAVLQQMQMQIGTGQKGQQLRMTVLRGGKQLELTIDLRHAP